MVEVIVDGPLKGLVGAGLELGYCARTGQVDVRLAARGEDCSRLVKEGEQVVRSLLDDYLYGEDDSDIETMVVRTLTDRRETLALAESCTGGLLAHRITNVPGASGVLLSGFVCYSNLSKQELLGVPAAMLAEHGAVSEPVARQLAEGARQRLHATYGMGITGIAGPTGGTAEKPVGTVYISVAGPEGTEVVRNFNPFDRETFKNATTQQALDLLRRTMRKRA
jgi:nicotinamide-nucleotide amidase